ncbi:MAG: hypothetical protein QOE23_528 [Pseudonocardiales bacterium]|jgi:hypothetical protein|nr:hypothetical protein [Pseudonocardiales bacterium]
MVAALDGVAIKLDRAAEHFETLDAGLRQFIELELSNSSRLVRDIDPDERGWQFLKWGSVPEPDRRLGAILGDFVHNVRSALDQTMWQLVKANGATPGKHTQWPVSETEGQWRVDITERDVSKLGPAPTAGLSNDAFELVRQFQPFQAGRRLRSKDPLLLLHRLSNVDKHRTMHVAASYPVEVLPNMRITPAGYLELTSVQAPTRPILISEGAILVRFKLRKVRWPPSEGVVVQVQAPGIGLQLAFTLDGEPIATLGHLDEMLTKARSVHAAALALPELTP